MIGTPSYISKLDSPAFVYSFRMGAIRSHPASLASSVCSWDVLEGQAVAGLDVGALAADDNIADLQAVGSDDVASNSFAVL